MDVREYEVNQSSNSMLHPWEAARIQVVDALLKTKLNGQQRNLILDIGCGDAMLLKILSEKWEETIFLGIDTALNEEIIRKLNLRNNNNRIKLFPDYNEISSSQLKPNVILLLDIIEHIKDDSEFLKTIVNSSYFSSTSKVLITVPAFQSLYVKRDEWLGHYRRYTVQSLSALAKENGLQILDSGYFFFSLVPVRWFQKVFEKKESSKSYHGINNWEGSKILARLISFTLVMDFRIGRFFNLLGIKIPGLSTYLLCKKQ